MATADQLSTAETYVRDVFPAKFADVLVDSEGFGALAHALTAADQVDPIDALSDFLERAQDETDDTVAPLARIATFTAPAAYVYSRLSV